MRRFQRRSPFCHLRFRKIPDFQPKLQFCHFLRKLEFSRVLHSPLLKKNFVPKFYAYTHPTMCIYNLTKLQDRVGYENPAQVAIHSYMSRMTLSTNISTTLSSITLPLRNSDLLEKLNLSLHPREEFSQLLVFLKASTSIPKLITQDAIIINKMHLSIHELTRSFPKRC